QHLVEPPADLLDVGPGLELVLLARALPQQLVLGRQALDLLLGLGHLLGPAALGAVQAGAGVGRPGPGALQGRAGGVVLGARRRPPPGGGPDAGGGFPGPPPARPRPGPPGAGAAAVP